MANFPYIPYEFPIDVHKFIYPLVMTNVAMV